MADQGPENPYENGHAPAIYAVWHDPSTYDHLKMGPPYLPGADTWKAAGHPKQASGVPDSDSLAEVRAMVSKEAANEEVANVLAHFLLDYGQESMAELAALLSFMRAINLAHQTHHWQASGPSFYADHQLFERLYNDTLKMIDQLAERSVGVGTPVLVNAVIQSTHVLLILKELYNGAPLVASPDENVLISLKGALRFLVLLQIVSKLMKAKGTMTDGIENLLQSFADKHEEFVYLLKQRSSRSMEPSQGGAKYARDPWKI
jgi:DNA-binding ferritin-like protein